MRIATAVLLTAAALAAGATEVLEPTPSRTATKALRYIDLDKPGMMEAIAAEDAERYQLIVTLLDRANVADCGDIPQVLRTEAQASSCATLMMMASYPPKRRATFYIDGTVYASNVVQDRLAEARLRKAQDR